MRRSKLEVILMHWKRWTVEKILWFKTLLVCCNSHLVQTHVKLKGLKTEARCKKRRRKLAWKGCWHWILSSVLQSWLRVSQQFHTISQVLVGSAVGSVFCILWLWSWEAFVLNAYTSYLWVRVLVIVGAVGFCLGFVLHVIKHWLLEEWWSKIC